MTEKLKTLKGIKPRKSWSNANKYGFEKAMEFSRAEAVKRYKHFEGLLEFANNEGYKQENIAGRMLEIKEFNNLTEEDIE